MGRVLEATRVHAWSCVYCFVLVFIPVTAHAPSGVPRNSLYIALTPPPVECSAWLPVGSNSNKTARSPILLVEARPQSGLFVGVSILARKWLAKMTKMAVLAILAKMTQKAWFSVISDFWGDLSRSFCIRRTIRAHLSAL